MRQCWLWIWSSIISTEEWCLTIPSFWRTWFPSHIRQLGTESCTQKQSWSGASNLRTTGKYSASRCIVLSIISFLYSRISSWQYTWSGQDLTRLPASMVDTRKIQMVGTWLFVIKIQRSSRTGATPRATDTPPEKTYGSWRNLLMPVWSQTPFWKETENPCGRQRMNWMLPQKSAMDICEDIGMEVMMDDIWDVTERAGVHISTTISD